MSFFFFLFSFLGELSPASPTSGAVAPAGALGAPPDSFVLSCVCGASGGALGASSAGSATLLGSLATSCASTACALSIFSIPKCSNSWFLRAKTSFPIAFPAENFIMAFFSFFGVARARMSSRLGVPVFFGMAPRPGRGVASTGARFSRPPPATRLRQCRVSSLLQPVSRCFPSRECPQTNSNSKFTKKGKKFADHRDEMMDDGLNCSTTLLMDKH